jgi:hypothetical protein
MTFLRAAFSLLLLLALSACGSEATAPPDTGAAADLVAAPDAAPDSLAADLAAPDLAAPDLAAPDLAAPDLAGSDAPPDAAGPLCDPRELAPGAVRAKPVACAAELPGGPYGAGRLGDLLIENALVRFVVRTGPEGHVLLGTGGGGVVDAVRVGPGGGVDRLRELVPIVSLNVLATDDVAIAADGADGEAVVRVTGRAVPLPLIADVLPPQPVDGVVTVEYVLRPDVPYLVVRTGVAIPPDGRASRVAASEVLFLAGDQAPFRHGAGRGSAESWTGPFVATGGPGVSYGLVADRDVTTFDLGGSFIFLEAGVGVPAGGERVVERALVVGDGGVSSVTDVAYARRDVETGVVRVTLAGAGLAPAGDQAGVHRVRVTDAGGRALSELSPRPGATVEARLPLGAVTLVAGCAGCPDGPPVAITVTADGEAAATVEGLPPGRVLVTVREPDGRVIPARLTLEDLDRPERGTTLRFARPAPGELLLAPGRYRVTATRGFEYERVTQELVVPAEGAATLDVTLPRSVPTPGAAAAEFHIHSELSPDSAVPLAERVLACAAEGLDFVVATEHDVVGDYGPTAAALGLAPYLATVPGVEISSTAAGHTQAWPLVPDLDRAGSGAPFWFGLSPPALVELARAQGAAIVQLNHPRFDYGSGFELIDFDPVTGRAQADPAALGFPPDTDLDALPYDAIEVFNGIGDEQLAAQLVDWYALLNQGRRMTATAGGDSHDLRAYPGNPRNYVFVEDDAPEALTAAVVADAVKAMRVLVTSGPFVEVGVLTPGPVARPGDVVRVAEDRVTLRLRVQAPSWMAVDEVRVVRGGAVVETIDLRGERPDPVLRLARDVELAVGPADTWLVVIAEGAERDRVAANHPPFAVTNPIWLDVDGDGRFTPRGAVP